MAGKLLRRVLPLIVLAAALSLALPAAGVAGGGGDTVTGISGHLTTGGSGGGAGNYWWFEIKGYDVLPWTKYQTILDGYRNGQTYQGVPASETQRYELKIAEKMSQDCGNPSFFTATTGAQQGCTLWQNYCPYAAPVKTKYLNLIGVNIQGCAAYGSSYAEWAQKYNGNSEIHTITYWGGSTSGKTIDLLVGWNVQVWREGHNAPIFQRRIGLTTPATDYDPAPINSGDWWAGGAGRDGIKYSVAGPLAGMLGAQNTTSSAPDNAPCKTRFEAAPTHFSYTGYDKPLPNKAHPPGSTWKKWGGCYWSLGDGEALWLKWTVASDGSPVAALSYELQGKPGHFYAIHVTAVDNREQLMTPFGGATADFWTADNYFRIFVATPGGQNPPKCLPGDPPPCPQPPPIQPGPGPPPPQLQSLLQPQTPMPTRAISTQTVQTSPAQALNSEQALFPETIALQHFTPQMNYNGSTIATSDYTDGAYAIYDSMTSSEPTVPYPYPGPHDGPQMLDMAYLQQPAHLDPSTPNTITSSNNFQITWLHPTLSNPCATGFAAFTAPWPATPSQCTDASNVRDAWDDTLTGKTTYEARWVGTGSTNDLGWISNEHLRCNDPVSYYGDGKYTAVSSCNPTFKLQSYSGPEYTTSAAQTQYAQSYVNVAHKTDAQHPDGNGAMHVVLTGSAQSALSGRDVYTRPSVDNQDPAYDTPQQIDATHGNQPNSQTGNNELWYCKTGLPVGADIAHGDIGNSGDSAVKDPAQTGDSGCRGYTVRWNWDAPGAGGVSNANVQDACSTVNNTPPPSGFHSPSVNFMSGGDQAQANSWGLYSNYDGQHNPDGSSPMAAIFQGNPTNWDTLLSETDGPTGQTVPTVPYVGLRPGAGSGYDHPGCAKSYGDGRWNAGDWSYTGTDTQQVGWTPAQPAQYGWVWSSCAYTVAAYTKKTTTYWKHGKKHTKISYVQNGTKCEPGYVWQETSPAVPAQPIYQTYSVWRWGWSGPCYPSNSTEQQQTATPSKTIGQQYYDSSVGGYVLPVHTQGDEQSLYDSKAGQPYAVGGNPVELSNPITDMSGQTCGRQVDGKLQTGQWRFTGPPQTGFGRNQTGYRLPSNQYVVSYQFSGPNIGGLTWGLTGSYDGYNGWKWYSKTMQNKPFTDPGNQAAMKVYGFRATR